MESDGVGKSQGDEFTFFSLSVSNGFIIILVNILFNHFIGKLVV
jgi:hypothetical protein